VYALGSGKSVYRGKGDIFSEPGFEAEFRKNNLEVFLADSHFSEGIFLSEARFGIVESGSLVFDSLDVLEEKARAKAALNVIILPIDKLIVGFQELELLLSLRSTHQSGLSFPSHLSFHHQPLTETVVFLVDQNRSALMEDSRIRQSLNCISCGLCSDICPVSQWIGEESYQSPYAGPIGSIRNSIQFEKQVYKGQTQATTSCGKCDVICPVNIPLSEILSYKQRKEVEEESSKAERLMYFLWRNGMEKRSKLEKGGSKIRNFMLRQFFRKGWGSERELPQVSQKSFHQLWMESRGKSH
jgi:L-lactate dehydrogenase complex protein LldF